MASDICQAPNCDNETGSADTDMKYRESRFCSPGCDLKYDHLQDDVPKEARREL